MFQDIRTLVDASHKPSVAGSSCGSVSILFGFLCHFWLWAIMLTSSADLQGWGGSYRTALSWLNIWWEEDAYGTTLLQTKLENAANNLHFSPIAPRSQCSMIISLYNLKLHELRAYWSNSDRVCSFWSSTEFRLRMHAYNCRGGGVWSFVFI